MAINTNTFETTLQGKLDNVTDPKEMLLLGKAYESTVGGIAVTDIQDEGTTQTNAVNTAGTTKVGEVNTAGSTQVTAVNNAGTTKINDINSSLSTQLKTVGGNSLVGSGDIAVDESIIKQWKVTSAPSQVTITAHRTSGATDGTYVGCEITMTPEDVNSWFRVHWDTLADDQGGSSNSDPGGIGIQLSVHTPSTGWVRKRDSGSHSFYYNALNDEYFRPTMDTVVKALNNELHTFRIYMDKHTGVHYRINSTISDDYRVDGWNNNHFEVQELRGVNFNAGNYTA